MPFSIPQQILWLLLLPIPVACVTRTFISEEIARELREFAHRITNHSPHFILRKTFYAFTCEYCFSHYVTLFFLILTQFRLLLNDWRGYLLSFFAIVFIANIYLTIYSRLRLDIHREKVEIQGAEKNIKK
jgi:hypothetical protein